MFDVTMAADCLSELIRVTNVAHLAHVLHTCRRNLLPARHTEH